MGMKGGAWGIWINEINGSMRIRTGKRSIGTMGRVLKQKLEIQGYYVEGRVFDDFSGFLPGPKKSVPTA